MIPKFNKQISRWGVWVAYLACYPGFWLTRVSTTEPLRFQSKQEAAARIKSLREAE